MRKTLGSLFSGGGGWDQGALDAGITPRFAVEMEPWIARWHASTFGEHVVNASVADVDYTKLPRVDILVSSPPCQATSQAGAQARSMRGEAESCDPGVGIFTLNAVDGTHPSVVFVENNSGYARGRTFAAILRGLDARGFKDIDWKVIDAADYGVPSGRERLIMRAARGYLPPWPRRRQRVSWYAAIADLIPSMPKDTLAPWQARGLAGNPPPGRTPLLIAGGNVTRNARGYIVFRTPSQPAWTTQLSKNTSGMRVIDEKGYVRKLTARAIARLQGFPDHYELPANRSQAIHVLGNSVPPLLAQQLLQPFAE